MACAGVGTVTFTGMAPIIRIMYAGRANRNVASSFTLQFAGWTSEARASTQRDKIETSTDYAADYERLGEHAVC